MMRILLIEDDIAVAKVIELALAGEGIVCDIAENGLEGLETSTLYDYDLVILDLLLPDMDGYDVLSRIRGFKNKNKTPILILSAMGGADKKIKGLCNGADDYLTKPFNNDELIARVKAIVRRAKGHSESVIKLGGLKVNFDLHTTTIDDTPVYLTGKEQTVLELLALRKGTVITKETFLNHLYNGMDEPEQKIIDVFICKMRKKLCQVSGGIDYIETIWGRGYTLRDPNAGEVAQGAAS